jgi:single-strand DNA-binding protein
MASVNKAIIVGNVGKDPDIRNTQGGGKCANFSVATGEKWKDKNTGETKERTEWHRIVVWNEGLVGVVEQYLRKGSRVYVEGEIQTRKWTDHNSVERYSTEIVVTGFRGQIVLLDRAGSGQTADTNNNASRPGNQTITTAQDMNDEVPF